MINSNLHQIIYGQLLSDGYIQLSKNGEKGNFKISFGGPYLPYANFIADLLAEYSPKIAVETKRAVKNGPYYIGYKLRTSTFTEFGIFHSIFYKIVDGRFIKIVPLNILEIMSPVVLAHLLMGDGNHVKSVGWTRIYTNSFTYSECVLLANAISTKLGIVCNVIKDRVSKTTGKTQYILTIGKKQLDKLQAVVGPHMHDSIKYRAGL